MERVLSVKVLYMLDGILIRKVMGMIDLFCFMYVMVFFMFEVIYFCVCCDFILDYKVDGVGNIF